MISLKELAEWSEVVLATERDNERLLVGVDDGGLTLKVVSDIDNKPTSQYLEVGGLPVQEEDDE